MNLFNIQLIDDDGAMLQRKPRTRLAAAVIGIALAVLVALFVVIVSAENAHAAVNAPNGPAACSPGQVVRRGPRGGLPRCTRAVWMPRGIR